MTNIKKIMKNHKKELIIIGGTAATIAGSIFLFCKANPGVFLSDFKPRTIFAKLDNSTENLDRLVIAFKDDATNYVKAISVSFEDANDMCSHIKEMTSAAKAGTATNEMMFFAKKMSKARLV